MTAILSSTQLSSFHNRGRDLLLDQTGALNAVIHDLHLLDEHKLQPSIWIPTLMLQAVGVSIHSILALTINRDMSIRDCFGIARSVVETALNAAYIAVEGDGAAKQAVRHMRQKRWRDLDRRGNIADLKFQASRDIGLRSSDLPGLDEALAEFTSKNGREKPSWTAASIEDRVNTVNRACRSSGMALGAAIFGVYRPASELLHGSYYGVNYFWQGSRQTPATDQPSFDMLWVMEHFVTLLSTVFLAVTGSIEAIAAVHCFDGHTARQKALSAELQRLIEAMSAVDFDGEHNFSVS